ncbi:PqqD family protein [Streptomyces osmaniensis]|uniref:Coenzyme PQQ synthesis protein D (PqqD) n=1 Tax=Streptomyces osmaniensis TaxID=593134 RepID=A0ABP6XVT4_9ACTN|nr:PqqD family peptide modification chaperone [Streptomyces sp. JCM17656]
MTTELNTPAPDATIRRRLDSRVRNHQGTLVIAGATQAFELTAVAAFVWRLLDGSRTVREVSLAVATEYSVDPAEALEDTRELLRDLLAHNVLEPVNNP